MNCKIGNDWDKILEGDFNAPYFCLLKEKVDKRRRECTVFPPEEYVFNAFKLCPFSSVKAVIIGQDPYHEKYQANGLCFSVQSECKKLPPSLKNIYKELSDDLEVKLTINGSLDCWAKNGVLMLNNVLTVDEGNADSHKGWGWETFTDSVIKKINEREVPCCFILWGDKAKKKKKLITNEKHCIIEGNHPSPLSANRGGFFGGRYFSRVNAFLEKNNIEAINWKT